MRPTENNLVQALKDIFNSFEGTGGFKGSVFKMQLPEELRIGTTKD